MENLEKKIIDLQLENKELKKEIDNLKNIIQTIQKSKNDIIQLLNIFSIQQQLD